MKFFTRPRRINIDRLTEKISRFLTKEHKRYKETTVLQKAKNYAYKGLPEENETSIEPYITPFRGFYTALKKKICVLLEVGIQNVLGMIDVKVIRQKVEGIKQTIKVFAEKITHLTIDRDRIYIDQDYHAYKKQYWVLCAFGLGECIWTMIAFLKLGDIVLLAASLGILIGLGQVFAVKYAVQAIKEIDDNRKQKIWSCVAFMFFSAVSFALNALRYWFVHKGDGADVPFVMLNPLTFVLINMLFMVGSALLVYFYYPSKEDLKRIREREKLDKEIKQVARDLQSVEAILSELLNEEKYLTQLRIKIMHAGKILQEQVDANYDESVGEFKDENAVKRTGRFPDAFKYPHAPLPNFDTEFLLILE